jgi:hypothetical protein
MKRERTTTDTAAVDASLQEDLFAASTEGLLTPGMDLAPLQVIRTETVLSKLPIHNLSKTGSFEIQIVRKNDRGEVELRWEVSYSSRYGPPRQLAYKIDTIVVNRRIDEQGRPVPKVIRLGSLRDIARELDLGGDTNNARKALRQNAFTGISARLTYRGIDGSERKIEADFTRYNVIFAGEKLPDGRSADCVYLILNEPYLEVLNSAPMRPLNYEYLKILPPAAQRFYEIVSYKMFAAFKHQHLQARLSYSDFCTCSAVQRYFDYDHFKKQMYKIHKPHLDSGYLEKINYERSVDGAGNPDWVMLYHPGPRAKAEFLIFQKRSGTTAPPSSQLEEPQNTEPVLSQLPAPAVRELPSDSLEQELITRGVSREQVRKLLSKTAPGQLISAQIQWGDALIRENRGRIYNPPGFYIYLIRGNVLPPADFLSQVQRSELEPGTQVDKTKPNDLDLQHAYEEYRRDEIDHYIAVQYPPAQYEELLNQIEKRVQKQYRSAALWRPENLRDVAAGILRQEIAMQLNFVTFEQFTGAGHTTIANNATDPLKLPVEGN